MHVLHLVGRSHRRGAEQVAMELAAELDRLGHTNELRAIGPGHEGETVAELPALTTSSRHRPLTLARAALAVRTMLHGDRCDVVLAHGAAAAIVAVAAAPRRPPRIVWQTILGLAERSFGGADAAMWRVVVRRLDAVVALTPEMGDEARHFGFRGPVWHLPNARGTERFEGLDRDRAAATLRSEIGLGVDSTLLGFVGYLVDQKRPQRSVDVLARVLGREPSTHLVVVGSGPLEEAVRARAREAGLADRVHMLGHRDDVPELLCGLDALIVTSSDEGVPGVVIEAAMAGCPVVTYRLGGVAEVVLEGTTGRVVDGDGIDDMADRVAELLGDPTMRARMSDAARAHGESFSMRDVASRYESRLRGLIPEES